MAARRPNNRKLYTLGEARRFLAVLGKIPGGTTKNELLTLLGRLDMELEWSHILGAHVIEESILRYEFPDLKHATNIARTHGRPGGDRPLCNACGGGFRRGDGAGDIENRFRRTYAPQEEINPDVVCFICGRAGRFTTEGKAQMRTWA